MGQAATNSHLNMGKEPFSTPQASRWTSNAMRIGGAVAQGIVSSGPLIFSCACLFLAYKKREKSSKLLQRSLSIAALHGGKVTLNHLILASAEIKHNSSAAYLALMEFKRVLNSDPIHFTKLQEAAAKLEMTGQEDEAVKLLTEAYEKAKKDSHEAYELEMLLVEMLIYNGRSSDALSKSCLKEEEITDVRRPLYKAVIHLLLDNFQQAQEAYDEYVYLQSVFFYKIYNIKEQTLLKDIEHNFDEFKKIINNLESDIEQVQKNKSGNEI